MLNERDTRVIETMAGCGCELESLFSMFPSVSKENVTEIFNRIRGIKSADKETDAGTLSINCS